MSLSGMYIQGWPKCSTHFIPTLYASHKILIRPRSGCKTISFIVQQLQGRSKVVASLPLTSADLAECWVVEKHLSETASVENRNQ